MSRFIALSLLGFATLPARSHAEDKSPFAAHAQEQAGDRNSLGSDLLLQHRVRFSLPAGLIGDEGAASALSLDLGHGRSLPPAFGSAPNTNLPKEFWGRDRQSAIKANLTLGF